MDYKEVEVPKEVKEMSDDERRAGDVCNSIL